MRVIKKQDMIWKTLLLGILIFVLVCTSSGSVFAAADSGEGSSAGGGSEAVTLRVAFPTLEGLSEFDGNGNPTGLVVDLSLIHIWITAYQEAYIEEVV